MGMETGIPQISFLSEIGRGNGNMDGIVILVPNRSVVILYQPFT